MSTTYSPTQRISELLPVLKTFSELSHKWYSDSYPEAAAKEKTPT